MAGSLTYQEIIEIFHDINNKKINIKLTDYNTFIETGTNYGTTAFHMAHYFKNIHTIELEPNLYNNCCLIKKTKKLNNVNLILGDSVEIFKSILPMLNEKIIFFLDGHYCGLGTAKGNKDCPLLEELQFINNRKSGDVIIIDDYRLFNTKQNEDWSSITIKNVIESLNNHDLLYFIRNDRLIILTLKEKT